MRKLATIRKIAEIKPIENADAIEAARVDGWWCVVKKNDFKVNDYVLYLEIDSWVPTSLAPFLTKPGKNPKEFNEVKGERLRTVRLRGQLSQGLLLSLAVLPIQREYHEHEDLTEELGIQLWEAPIPAQLSGQILGYFPSFIRKTDQERIQNIPEILNDPDTRYEVTVKYDGSSITVYAIDGRPGVCSRNLDLKLNSSNNENTFVKTARVLGLIDAVLCFHAETGRSIAVQGELMGPGIQKNREDFDEHRIYVFDIWDIDNQKYLTPHERYFIFSMLTEKHGANIRHAKTLEWSKMLGCSMESILALPEFYGPFALPLKLPVEGIVFKSLDGNTTFKVINNKFLEEEK